MTDKKQPLFARDPEASFAIAVILVFALLILGCVLAGRDAFFCCA